MQKEKDDAAIAHEAHAEALQVWLFKAIVSHYIWCFASTTLSDNNQSTNVIEAQRYSLHQELIRDILL